MIKPHSYTKEDIHEHVARMKALYARKLKQEYLSLRTADERSGCSSEYSNSQGPRLEV
jgi:hypothetical protein